MDNFMVGKPTDKSTIDKLPDTRLYSNIWNEIQNNEDFRNIDLNDLSISIQNGKVLLEGHLTQKGNKQRIESIVENIPGVISVVNELIIDSELKNKVAQALAKNPRTHIFLIFVGVFHGWVHLGGKVRSTKDQEIVEQVAASLQNVRGVLTLPQITNGQRAVYHQKVQPVIGSMVYDQANSPGQVCKVVIDPKNRLIISVVVELPILVKGHSEEAYFNVCSNYVRVANAGGVILDDSLPDLTTSPVFDQVEFVFPPEEWSPPYPYKTGEVLWPKGVSNV